MDIWQSLFDLIFPSLPDDAMYCPECGGTGYGKCWKPCKNCNSTGYIERKHKRRH